MNNYNPNIKATNDAGERLAKKVASIVPCSRRQAELYIESGRVRVNGKVTEEPRVRVSKEVITINEDVALLVENNATILLHKPPEFDDGDWKESNEVSDQNQSKKTNVRSSRDLLVSTNRATDDDTSLSHLKKHLKNLTAPVPLERAACGLIVFTQDWRILRKLSEDLGLLEQEIIVDIKGGVQSQTLNRINQGISIKGERLPNLKVSINSSSTERSKLRFAIKGSHLGLIAFICERLGLEILSMKRIRIGRILLRTLPQGQWRYLHPSERF